MKKQLKIEVFWRLVKPRLIQLRLAGKIITVHFICAAIFPNREYIIISK
jgi:hypothetical protein